MSQSRDKPEYSSNAICVVSYSRTDRIIGENTMSTITTNRCPESMVSNRESVCYDSGSSDSEISNNFEDDENVMEAVEKLRELIKGEKRLHVGTDTPYLINCLLNSEMIPELTFQRIVTVYKGRLHYADYCCKGDPANYSHLMSLGIVQVLRERDTDGRLIAVYQQSKIDPSKITCEELGFVEDIFLHLAVQDERTMRAGGPLVIVNGAGLRWQIMKWFTWKNINAYARKAQISPFRKLIIHFINTSSVLSATISLVWPVIALTEAAKTMYFHYQDASSLHKHIDPAILPKSLCGYLEDSEAFVDPVEMVSLKRDKLKEMLTHHYDS